MVHKLYISREKLDIVVRKNKGCLFSHVCASANEIMLKTSGFLLMAEKGFQMHGNYQHAEHQRKALSSPGRKELVSKFKKKKSTLIYKSFYVLTRARQIFAERLSCICSLDRVSSTFRGMELGLFSRVKQTQAEIQLETTHFTEAERNTAVTQRSHITLNLTDYAYMRRNIPNAVLNSEPNFYCFVYERVCVHVQSTTKQPPALLLVSSN